MSVPLDSAHIQRNLAHFVQKQVPLMHQFTAACLLCKGCSRPICNGSCPLRMVGRAGTLTQLLMQALRRHLTTEIPKSQQMASDVAAKESGLSFKAALLILV